MPIFEFKCVKCNTRQELLVMPHDTEGTDIPICCGKLMERVIGTFNFKVKGHNSDNGYSRKPSIIDNPPR